MTPPNDDPGYERSSGTNPEQRGEPQPGIAPRRGSGQRARIAAGMALPLLRQLRADGLDVESFLEPFGLCEEKFALPEVRLPHETFMQLLEACQLASGSATFALRAAQQQDSRIQPLLYHLVSSQQTVRDVLAGTARYFRVLYEGISIDVTDDDDVMTMEVKAEPGLSFPPIAVEFLLARWSTYGFNLVGDTRYELSEIQFRHEARVPLDVYEHFFGTRVVFGSQTDSLVGPSWNLDLPLASANDELGNALKEKVEEMLARLSDQPSLSRRVRGHLMSQLQYANTGIDKTARHFNMSERTLRRQLKEEGTTFKEILSELRRELAIKYLRDNDLSSKEIALLLGYSELSTFNRAFKSWTKLTPSQYRRL